MYLKKINFDSTWLTNFDSVPVLSANCLTIGAVLELEKKLVNEDDDVVCLHKIVCKLLGPDIVLTLENFRRKLDSKNKAAMSKKKGPQRDAFLSETFHKENVVAGQGGGITKQNGGAQDFTE